MTDRLLLECLKKTGDCRDAVKKAVIREAIGLLENTDIIEGIIPEIKIRLGLANTNHYSALIGKIIREALEEAKEIKERTLLAERVEEI